MQLIKHSIPPVFDSHCRILILGSFPSVKSREGHFFYHHPQNRFWKVLAAVTGQNAPVTPEEKRLFLLEQKIALWDVIASCEIEGSSDSSIRNVIANDLSPILHQAPIQAIFTNGATAHRLYNAHIRPATGIDAIKLPSTSPANAAANLDKLIVSWSQIVPLIKTEASSQTIIER